MRLNLRTRRFVPNGPYATKRRCPVCNRTGYGPEFPTSKTAAPWQRDCLKGHPFACACGRLYPCKQAIAAHIRKAHQDGRIGHVRVPL